MIVYYYYYCYYNIVLAFPLVLFVRSNRTNSLLIATGFGATTGWSQCNSYKLCVFDAGQYSRQVGVLFFFSRRISGDNDYKK